MEELVMSFIEWDKLSTQTILDIIKNGKGLNKSIAFK